MVTALVIIVLIIAIIIAVSRLGGQSSSSMNYINDLRELLINGSFTAMYYENATYVTIGSNMHYETNEHLIDYMSIGFINGSRAFVRIINVVNITNPLYTTPPIVQGFAYWISAPEELCMANYIVMYSGRNGAIIDCLTQVKPNASALLLTYLPFNEFLGNYALNMSYGSGYLNQYNESYAEVIHIKYINESSWHGETTYCYNVTTMTKTIMINELLPKANYTTLENTTEIICLLPNGIATTQVIHDTLITLINGNEIAKVISVADRQLMNYTLNYFNTTAFNELILMRKARKVVNRVV